MTTAQNNPVGFWHRERNLVKICGRFQVDATPDISAWVGEGFEVSRTGVGDYLVEFTDAFSDLITVKANCQCAIAATDLYAQPAVFTAGGAGAASLQILTHAAGANTEVTADDWVHFEATLYSEGLGT